MRELSYKHTNEVPSNHLRCPNSGKLDTWTEKVIGERISSAQFIPIFHQGIYIRLIKYSSPLYINVASLMAGRYGISYSLQQFHVERIYPKGVAIRTLDGRTDVGCFETGATGTEVPPHPYSRRIILGAQIPHSA